MNKGRTSKIIRWLVVAALELLLVWALFKFEEWVVPVGRQLVPQQPWTLIVLWTGFTVGGYILGLIFAVFTKKGERMIDILHGPCRWLFERKQTWAKWGGFLLGAAFLSAAGISPHLKAAQYRHRHWLMLLAATVYASIWIFVL